MTMTIEYLAGLIEGEGSFGFNGLGISPIIRVEMTDRDVVQKVFDCYGGYFRFGRSLPSGKESWVWGVQGSPAIKLMEELLPHMGLRRSAKILELMDIWGGNQKTNIICNNGHQMIGNNVYLRKPVKPGRAVARNCKQCRRVDPTISLN